MDDIKTYLSLRKVLNKVFAPIIIIVQYIWALSVLFFEWGWHPLSEILGKLKRFVWFERLEQKIENLSPYPALFIFLTPLGILFPVKLIGLWMLVHGYLIMAVGLIFLAKVFATAVLAHTFKLTKDKILLIRWFAILHDRFVSWKNQIFLIVRNSLVWKHARLAKGQLIFIMRDFQGWVRTML